ncbi:MAG: hypothetical protein IPL28_28060 [Chloroflexi bacterium]|nr:hypothetical protein [Chloroflexota bacterium]
MIPSNWTIYALGGALIAFILLFGYVWPHRIAGSSPAMAQKLYIFRVFAFIAVFVGAFFALPYLWLAIFILFLSTIPYAYILFFLWQYRKAGTILLKLERSADEKQGLLWGSLFFVYSLIEFGDLLTKDAIWAVQSWREIPHKELYLAMPAFLYLAGSIFVFFTVLYKKELSKTGIFDSPWALSWDKVVAYQWKLIEPVKLDWYLEIQRAGWQSFPFLVVVTAAQKAAVEAILEEYCAGKNTSANH